ncbi:MAG TPA: hypothetical protein PLR18_01045 [bacterium]|nr:hypothetical protein [bacterium]
MKNQLDKIIYFVKNTGDKVIVLKDNSEFIIMPLDDYEGLFRHKKELAALSEEEMLSRVNREIALWRESQKICVGEVIPPEEKNINFYPSARLRDDNFYYNHLDEAVDEDLWVEPDWTEDGDEDYDEFDPEEELDLPPDFFGPEEKPENKKGADDISLPLEHRDSEYKPTSDRPAPKKRINNFGYANPIDTDGPVSERGYGESYDHIPPPPSR